MNSKSMKLIALAILVFAVSYAGSLFADPAQIQVSTDVSPLRYTAVNGNSDKFKEHHWMNDGYAGGIDEFSIKASELPNGWMIEGDGHGIPADNDYEANLLIQKPEFAYVKFEYQEFTKYYDNSGGYYYPFKQLSSIDINRDLELQIGHFRIETGLMIEDVPQVSLAYEHGFKNGDKSHLTWGGVTEGSVTRNIAPSFQEIDESVDTFELKIQHEIKGVEIKNEEQFELTESKLSRYEANYSTNATASEKKQRRQDQRPESRLFSSTTSAQKWYGEEGEEKVFTGGAYHFLHMSNTELENIFEMNADGKVVNFSNPKAIRAAFASNDLDSHTWVGNVMYMPWKPLSLDFKLRAESIDKSGDSNYPSDTTPVAAGGLPPDGIINNNDVSLTKDSVARFGESFSLKFTAIPRTVLYSDLEFEQVENDLEEDRNSLAGQSAPNTGEIFSRETVTNMLKDVWTLGAQFYPCKFIDGFVRFRMNRTNEAYDDQYETGATASGAKSAFFDGLDIHSHELNTRWVFKPVRWLRPSVHYKYLERIYTSDTEGLGAADAWEKTQNVTLDVTVQPTSKWLFMSGISRQFAWVTTTSQTMDLSGPPRFNNSNWTGFLNSTYTITPKVNVFGALDYAVAHNFNDFSTIGLPLGADYNQFDMSSGVNVNVTENLSVQLQYAYFLYQTNENSETGNYGAHQIGVKTKLMWD